MFRRPNTVKQGCGQAAWEGGWGEDSSLPVGEREDFTVCVSLPLPKRGAAVAR